MSQQSEQIIARLMESERFKKMVAVAKTANNISDEHQSQLPNLSAGSEWAEYLIMNGWQLTELSIGVTCDEATFIKGNEKIEYFCSDKNGSTFRHYKLFLRNRWNEINTLNCVDMEADVTRFAFFCHAMGFVDFSTAKLIVEDANGVSVSKNIRSLFCTTKSEASQMADEMIAGFDKQ